MARGCLGQQVPGDQVDGGNKVSAGRAVESGGMGACLAKQSKTGTREGNGVQRLVQLSLGVADGRRIQYTEGEGVGFRKQSNGGTEFKIRC